MNRLIDISSDNKHLSRSRGFLIISEERAELARIPLDDIFAIIIHAHGVTYSNSLLVELARRGAIAVLCGANHFPIAYLAAIDGHHAQSGRISDQIAATKPLNKQLWRQLVVQKVKMQAAVLSACNVSDARLNMLSREIKSGDPSNIEAQAARHYWPKLMGDEFRRDRNADDANGLLNYGYTVLRAAVARAVIATGLHPSLGIHHTSRVNAFALADDLIEPFRPFVDYTVQSLLDHGHTSVDPTSKRALSAILDYDVNLGDNRSPISTAIKTLCTSLVSSYAERKAALTFPLLPSPADLAALGGEYDNS